MASAPVLAQAAPGRTSPVSDHPVSDHPLGVDHVDQSRAAGLPVRTRITTGLDRLRPHVATARCRLVREALTNVHRHAGTVPTTVRVAATAGVLTVEVSDQRPPRRPETASVGSHRGLRGLASRCQGRLAHGPTADGGFAVRVELPLAQGSVRNEGGAR